MKSMVMAEGERPVGNSLGGTFRKCRCSERKEAKAEISKVFAGQAVFTDQEGLLDVDHPM